MARTTDPRERLDLLLSRIDSIMLNVFFAIAAFRFEDQVHQTYRTDGELSPEQLNEYYVREERLYRGDAADPSQRASWWSSFGHHIFAPGYMYAYAFGCLLALAAYGQYNEAGDSFRRDVLRVLTRQRQRTTGSPRRPARLRHILGRLLEPRTRPSRGARDRG